MRLEITRRRVLSGSILLIAMLLMLTLTGEPNAKAEPQAALAIIPLAEALIKAAPSISSFFQKLFPDPAKAKKDQTDKEKTETASQNKGKSQLEGSVVREKVLATVLRASSGAASGTAAMTQAIKNHVTTTDGEKVDLRQMWSEVSSKLKTIAKGAPNLDVFLAGSEQKLALQTVIDYSNSMPEEVNKEIEGKDATSCTALQKSMSDLGAALLRLNNAGAEELNVIADSIAVLTLPEADQTPAKGKVKADGLNKSIGFGHIDEILIPNPKPAAD
jgi:hypothetical protein